MRLSLYAAALMPFLFAALGAGPALAVRIAVPVNMQIFDGPSGQLQNDRGTLVVDKFDEVLSPFRLQSSKGTTVCSGTRRMGVGGGTFSGKCLGIAASGRYTQSASGVVDMIWNFKDSWIKIRAKVQ